MFAHIVPIISALSFDEVLAIIALVVNCLQVLVLPVTIYYLAVQTRAMRLQTTALVEQSKEMTTQTRVFIDTIYSSTYQNLYDAEAHIGELMMMYPEASRILMSPVPQEEEKGKVSADFTESLQAIDPELRERVRWLGTAMLDFFEHIWTQAQKGGMPGDMWEAWEDYMGKEFSETRLRYLWYGERGFYFPGFRRFVDLKVGIAPEVPVMPPIPRPLPTGVSEPLADNAKHISDNQAPQVARVLRAVTEDNSEKEEKS